VLAQLHEPRRFSKLRASVAASPRALTLALKELQAAGLVRRRVSAGYPPAVAYEATPAAAALVSIAQRLGEHAARR